MRRGGLSVMLVALLLGAIGCGQFTARGAKDPCSREPGLTVDEIQSCWQDQSAVLTGGVEGEDRTAGGWLRGESLPIAGRQLRHVVALDYSGSMWGGYQDPEPSPGSPCGWTRTASGRSRNSPFHWERQEFAALLEEGPLAALAEDQPVHPLPFNQGATVLGAEGHSEFDARRGAFENGIPAALRGRQAALLALTASPIGRLPVHPARAPFGNPSETRLNDVLKAASALFEEFEERDGVLWILTDNIIERQPGRAGGALQDARLNREFYQTLRSDPRWQVVYAWPIHRAPWLCGSTLMVYGMYYSSRERIEERQYGDLTSGPAALIGHAGQIEAFRRFADPGSPSPGSPFKLKPDDLDVVRLSFLGQVRCQALEIGRRGECLARLEIRNLLNHRQVEMARFSLTNGRCEPWGLKGRRLVPVRSAVPICSEEVNQEFELQSPIPPRGARTLEIRFSVPPIETERSTLADHWESASFSRFLMIGRMEVAIRQLQTAMIIEEAALGEIYGVEALPEIFRNPSTENLDTSICLNLAVDNPSFLGSLVLLGLVFLLVLIFLAVVWLLKPSYRFVEVDGEPRGRIRLVRLASTPLLLDGTRIGGARLGLGGEPKLRADKGHILRKRGGSWMYVSDDEGTQARIALVRRSRGPVTRRDDDF